jgi:hypothetical protein
LRIGGNAGSRFAHETPKVAPGQAPALRARKLEATPPAGMPEVAGFEAGRSIRRPAAALDPHQCAAWRFGSRVSLNNQEGDL